MLHPYFAGAFRADGLQYFSEDRIGVIIHTTVLFCLIQNLQRTLRIASIQSGLGFAGVKRRILTAGIDMLYPYLLARTGSTHPAETTAL
ncbi:hypothetical protein SAMN05421863_10691 [Nitrosomonas communis]|uniref:Uncharacterized protein n=1 Tax=Nitrosomonas communis TaxID=44574 RepID=A0A1I4UR39_9PROT|nr:hypothetical protein SAMN05421863_10691 [Nitrosomonas communis]